MIMWECLFDNGLFVYFGLFFKREKYYFLYINVDGLFVFVLDDQKQLLWYIWFIDIFVKFM